MTVIAMCSAKGSPGVTVTALAAALTWQRPVVLAECDPAGGDITSGYLRHLELDGQRGLMQLVVAELRGQAGDQFWGQLVDLEPPHRRRLLLPGITRPAQAASLDPSWHQLAGFFAGLAHTGFDVIVDCGRLVVPYAPWQLVNRADLVLLVVRPTLSSLVAAKALLDSFSDQFRAGVSGRIGLVAVGDGDYDDHTLARTVGAPVLAHVPHDRHTAAVLTDGGTLRTRWPLMRAVALAQRDLVAAVDYRRQRLVGPPRWEAADVGV